MSEHSTGDNGKNQEHEKKSSDKKILSNISVYGRTLQAKANRSSLGPKRTFILGAG